MGSVRNPSTSSAPNTNVYLAAAPYGVVANDGTDQSAKIQQAISDFATSGGRFVFPRGVINCNNIAVPPGDTAGRFSFEGDGWATALKLNDQTQPLIFLNGNADTLAGRVAEFKISNMMLTAPASYANVNGHGILANYAHRCAFDRVRIEGMPGDGIRFAGTGYDNWITGGCLIWSNKGIGVNDASASEQSTPLWVLASRIEGNAGGGVNITSPTFHAAFCTIEGNGNWEVYAHLKAHGVLFGCHLENNALAQPLLQIGDTAEAGWFPDIGVEGCEFYGNVSGAVAGNRGIYVRQAGTVNVRGGTRLGSLNLGIDAGSNTTEVDGGTVFTSNQANYSGVGLSVLRRTRISGDNGTAATVNLVATDSETQRWDTTLTQNVTANLPTADRWRGMSFVLKRTAGGAFTLTVAGAGLSRTLAQNEWMRVQYDYSATTWYVVEHGWLTEVGGTATFSGTGAQTAFNIAHGLGFTPNHVSVDAGSSAAAAAFYVSAIDATNVTVTFSAAPANAANNVVLRWLAR